MIKIAPKTKNVLIAVVMVLALIFSVMGQHFADAAKTVAGAQFWDFMTVAGILVFLGGILYYFLMDKTGGK